MEAMTRASLNGYTVMARIESGHGRSPLLYRRLHGLGLRPCPVKLLNIEQSPWLYSQSSIDMGEAGGLCPYIKQHIHQNKIHIFKKNLLSCIVSLRENAYAV